MENCEYGTLPGDVQCKNCDKSSQCALRFYVSTITALELLEEADEKIEKLKNKIKKLRTELKKK